MTAGVDRAASAGPNTDGVGTALTAATLICWGSAAARPARAEPAMKERILEIDGLNGGWLLSEGVDELGNDQLLGEVDRTL